MKTPPNHHIPALMLGLDREMEKAAEKYGTPLFFYSAEQLAADWHALRRALPRRVSIRYSVKANPTVAIIETLAALGAEFEISSLGELKALKKAQVDPARALFVGPGKSAEELCAVLDAGVGLVAVESERELRALENIASRKGKTCDALIRVNPGMGYGDLKMSGATQFGMDPASAIALLRGGAGSGRVRIVGVHAFMGTRLLDWNKVASNFESVLAVADAIAEATGMSVGTIGLGGGLGVPLYEGDGEIDLDTLGEILGDQLVAFGRKRSGTEKCFVELGRSLVARCGVLLVRVVDVKETAGTVFAIVDGGIGVLGGRDVLIGGKNVPLRILADGGREEAVATVCGPLCTPADRLAVKVLMGKPEPGDLMAFYVAGAYCLSASPVLFLSRGVPGEAMLKNGVLKLVRAPMSPDEILAGQFCWSDAEPSGYAAERLLRNRPNG